MDRHLSQNERCEMKVRIIVQRFVNKARNPYYSYITLSDEYFEIIDYCREVYGLCPNEYGKLYDRLPAALQDGICETWKERC